MVPQRYRVASCWLIAYLWNVHITSREEKDEAFSSNTQAADSVMFNSISSSIPLMDKNTTTVTTFWRRPQHIFLCLTNNWYKCLGMNRLTFDNVFDPSSAQVELKHNLLICPFQNACTFLLPYLPCLLLMSLPLTDQTTWLTFYWMDLPHPAISRSVALKKTRQREAI